MRTINTEEDGLSISTHPLCSSSVCAQDSRQPQCLRRRGHGREAAFLSRRGRTSTTWPRLSSPLRPFLGLPIYIFIYITTPGTWQQVWILDWIHTSFCVHNLFPHHFQVARYFNPPRKTSLIWNKGRHLPKERLSPKPPLVNFCRILPSFAFSNNDNIPFPLSLLSASTSFLPSRHEGVVVATQYNLLTPRAFSSSASLSFAFRVLLRFWVSKIRCIREYL